MGRLPFPAPVVSLFQTPALEAWLPGIQIVSCGGVIGIISTQRTAKANWGSRWRWAKAVLKMCSDWCTEIETGKRLNRKGSAGPWQKGGWEVGKKAHCLLVAEV